MTEIKHEYGNWNVYVDGNPKFSFVYKQEAEAVAEMIDALATYVKLDDEVNEGLTDKRVEEIDYDYSEALQKAKQALIKLGCIDGGEG